ncbi:transcriptional regulator, LysR family [Desulfitobacterium hafniense DCB-2]|uniref:Transcriptional regulator, LysR family n=2 Tax=Desulfitobacterium hafniense TaxID=49338 RepID=B8FQI3_DESHD|nr:LysR substrate-binding domain-containing protein [Desulfitobacterium hafniense]ACL19873.1 transcriptional regulator, LysR family [Desulfitobacterium hafniense DCB-2]
MNYLRLKYFTVIAKHLNFSKAAQELYISQPALSKHIMELEKHFGTALFVRTNRNLILTAAGKVLLSEAEKIFAREPEVFHLVKEASAKEAGKLSIAFVSTSLSFHIPLLVKHYNQDYPMVDVSLQRLPWGKVEHAVINNQADIGFIISFDDHYLPFLDSHVLTRTYSAIVAAHDHPLATQDKVHISQLKNEHFIQVSPSTQPIPYNYIILLCENAGFTPNIATTCPLVETVLMMVQAGLGISVLSRLAPVKGMDNLKFIDIEGVTPSSFSVVWKKDSNNPYLERFINRIKQYQWPEFV